MKNQRINFATCALLSATTCLLAAHNVKAEGEQKFGEGAHGVNRVVRTQNGYTGVQVKVDNLSFSMPTNEAGLYEKVDALNHPTLDSLGNGSLDTQVQPLDNVGTRRPQGNKPSTYVGGEFRLAVSLGNDSHGNPVRTQVDAGLQYEPVTLDNTGAGWSVFFYLHGVGYKNADGTTGTTSRMVISPRVWDGSSTVANRGIAYRSQTASMNGTMTLDARPSGSVGFTYDKMGTIYANLQYDDLTTVQQNRWKVSQTHPIAPWGDGGQAPPQMFDTTRYNEANVKRVAAMTRDDPYTSNLDGSPVIWMVRKL